MGEDMKDIIIKTYTLVSSIKAKHKEMELINGVMVKNMMGNGLKV
jgi:hypothetical protein